MLSSRALLSAAAVLLLAGCSPASPVPSDPATVPATLPATATPTATAAVHITPIPEPTIVPVVNAPDSNVTVELVAEEFSWDRGTISAPAEMVWHVEIDSRTEQNHNFVVTTDAPVPQRLYASETFGEGTYTYDIPGLPAGTYVFICTFHAAFMAGNLTID
jgi:plastocyanin